MPPPPPSPALLAQTRELYVSLGPAKAAAALKLNASTVRLWGQRYGWSEERVGRLASASAPEAPDALALASAHIKRLEGELRSAQAAALSAAGVRQILTGLAAYEPQAPTWRIGEPWRKGKMAGVPLLFLSDWHWGEVVVPHEVLGFNAYDPAIAAKRLRRTVETSVGLLRNHIAPHAYEEIVVVLGGDLISGDIHEDFIATNAQEVGAQALDCVDHFSAALRLLANEFGRVRVVGVPGNHGRTTRKPRSKHYAETNWDWVVYQMIERTLRADARFAFDFPPARDMTFTVAGVRCRLTHGDQFRGGDGMIGALGPIVRGDKRKRSTASLFPSREHDYDVIFVGHWHAHHFSHTHVVNGSGKGWDGYALAQGFDFEPPIQMLLTLHPEFRINSAWPIYCDGGRTKALDSRPRPR